MGKNNVVIAGPDPDYIADEQLIELYRQGDRQALDILFKRYIKPLKCYLVKNSWFKDHAYLDDVLQDIFLIAFESISKRKFADTVAGSFKKYIYEIAHLECIKQDKKQSAQEKPFSQFSAPDEKAMLYNVPAEAADETEYDNAREKAHKILSKLSLPEQKLIIMLSQGKSYKEIQQHQWFSKYSLDYLMRKVYKIRKRVYKLQKRKE